MPLIEAASPASRKSDSDLTAPNLVVRHVSHADFKLYRDFSRSARRSCAKSSPPSRNASIIKRLLTAKKHQEAFDSIFHLFRLQFEIKGVFTCFHLCCQGCICIVFCRDGFFFCCFPLRSFCFFETNPRCCF